MTDENVAGKQIEFLPPAPSGLQEALPSSVAKPSRTGLAPSRPHEFTMQSSRQLAERNWISDVPRPGEQGKTPSAAVHRHTLPRTVPCEVHSVTVREPFQQYVTSSRPLHDPRSFPIARPPNLGEVFSGPPTIQHAPMQTAGKQAGHMHQRQAPLWSTPVQRSSMPSPRLLGPRYNTPGLDPPFQLRDSLPDHSIPEDRFNRGSSFNPAAMCSGVGVLSSQQIAARQVVGKDLPTFNGNPTDWSMFITSFEQSTAACGFSNAENLVRLQRCLTGHAREAVRSRLLLPANVPHVVDTLRTSPRVVDSIAQ